MTQEELQAKWNELCDAAAEDYSDPYPAWMAFLTEGGLDRSWSVQANWGEFGIMPFVDDLLEIVNDGEELEILEDPSCEGSDTMGFLAFPRKETA